MDKISISFDKKDLYTSFGTACFLCGLMCSLTGKMSDFSSIDYANPLCFSLSGIAVILLLAAIPLFKSQKYRIALTILNMCISIAWAASAIYLTVWNYVGQTENTVAEIVFGTAGRISSIILTIQWSFHVASYKEKQSIPIVLSIGILTSLLYLTLVSIGGIVATTLVISLTAASIILCYILEKSLQESTSPEQLKERLESEHDNLNKNRKSWKRPPSKRIPSIRNRTSHPRFSRLWLSRLCFFGSRIIWGALYGTLLGLCAHMGTPTINSGWIVFVAIVCLVTMLVGVVATASTDHIPVLITILFPISLSLILLSCFEKGDPTAYGQLFVGIAILPWFLQMYLQLPSYRSVMEMNTAKFAYLERLLALLSFEFVSSATIPAIRAFSVTASGYALLGNCTAWLAMCLITATTVAMLRHYYLYYPMHAKSNGEITPEELNGKFEKEFGAFSARYDISKREQEVLALLAEGYSRPYIEKKLFISTGTVKTHSYHIYQKLNVNSQDELIELVKSEVRSQA